MSMKYFYTIFLFVTLNAVAQSSTCYGTTANGRIENTVQLPPYGTNFIEYSALARMAGRVFVHSQVKDIILAAYKDLEKEQPAKVYKYAETGYEKGGEFKPHKTHRNGLSVDFMTPVIDREGNSVHLPTNLLNRLGYAIEFNEKGYFENYKIDYEALAAHIVALDRQAKLSGHKLWRVIFDPKLQPNLYKTKYADYLRANIKFSKKPSWVRHDEHYHIDFSIPCKN